MKALHRIAKWDNAKFLLILLVVIGHFVDLYTKNSASAKSLFLFIYLFISYASVYFSGGLIWQTDCARKTI